jgi:pimeloyl-ACP methyl ester carboxylesterase
MDAQATWRYATNQLKRSPEHILLFGESLGGAVAVELACQCCVCDAVPAGVLLTATFANLPETAARLYPMFPVRWIVRDRFSSRDLIGSVTCPIVQVHGRLDELVTLDEAEQLFEAAPPASTCGVPKRMVVIDMADHNGVPDHALGQELRALLNDIERVSNAE